MKRKNSEESADKEESVPASTADQARPISVWLTDPDVLDCSICLKPLFIPVFQCENGHAICRKCSAKVSHKCPSCKLLIGIRCRAIEKVLESAMRACKNQSLGCKETIRYPYTNAKEHEKVCKYAPCACPFKSCTFSSSSENLSLHFRAQHTGSALCFRLRNDFEVKLEAGARFVVLQEEELNVLFVLNRREEHVGNMIWLECLSPDSSKGFGYNIVARGKAETRSRRSVTTCVQSLFNDDDFPLSGIFLVQSDFLCPRGELALELNIFGDSPC